jgi:carbon monoxide dehydrogenase subunit G
MKIRQEFDVAGDPAQVWEFFHDVPSVAQCLPGAELHGQRDHGGYHGKLSARMGPISMSFDGEATVVFSEDERIATIEGTGVDSRGGSRGQVKVVCQVEPGVGTGTHVTVEADLLLSGAAAQFGRTGLIDEISRRLIGDFVTCLEAKIIAQPDVAATIQAPKPPGFSLLLHSLWAWLKGSGRRKARV